MFTLWLAHHKLRTLTLEGAIQSKSMAIKRSSYRLISALPYMRTTACSGGATDTRAHRAYATCSAATSPGEEMAIAGAAVVQFDEYPCAND